MDCLLFLTTNIETFGAYNIINEQCKEYDIDCYFFMDIHKYDARLRQSINLYLHKINNNIMLNRIVLFDGETVFSQYTNWQLLGHGLHVKYFEGNALYVVLEFFKNISNKYDYYWYLEDDMLMPKGNYGEFFNKCMSIDADLLLPAKKYEYNEPDWWFNRYLKCDINKYPIHNATQLYRLSKNGVLTLIDKFNGGDGMHAEGVIPSVIESSGLTTKYMDVETGYGFNIYCPPPGYNKNIRVYNNIEYNNWYHPIKMSHVNK